MFAVYSRVKVRISNLKYIVDSSGERVAVVLPIDEYNELLEDLHDLAVIAKRKDEPMVSFEEVKERLRECGVLSD